MLFARHRLLPDVIGQGERRLLAAAVRLSVRLAGLPRLRRVDAEQPDTLAVDLDRVAVDHRSAAGEVGGAGCFRPAQQGGNGEPDGEDQAHGCAA